MQENNQTPAQINPEPQSDAQSEINNLISSTPGIDNPAVPEVPTVVHTPPQNMPEEVSPQSQPTPTQPQTEAPNPYSFESKNTTIQDAPQQTSTKIIYILGGVIVVLIAVVGFMLFRNRAAGNFESCIQNENNTVVMLEPAYCLNKNGDILYRDLSNEEVENINRTTDPSTSGPFETILP